jgi:uncharacterized membrane protein
MVKKGGGPIAELLGTGISLGTSYYAYKNSDSFAGFLWLRFYYGLLFVLFVFAIIGIPVLLFFLFAKKSPLHDKDPQSPTTYVPGQPSK